MNSVKGHIVDVVSREIYDGELMIRDGKIAEVKRCTLPEQEKPWPYVMPGFIDSHVHIESNMMVPHKFARIAVSHGTIGVVADPHEIGNVLGIQELVNKIGCQMKSPFITMAFMCLPVIPDIKMTDRHLMDTKNFKAIY